MPTDTQLREALAKMLPERVFFNPISGNLNEIAFGKVTGRTILDTELLQLCWDVEETLTDEQYKDYQVLIRKDNEQEKCQASDGDLTMWTVINWRAIISVAWQQRVIALCKVKGIDL